MRDLPASWTVAPISDLILLNPKLECDDEATVGFVPMSFVGTTYLAPVKYEERTWGEIRKGYTHFADGDVLLAKITPCFENGKSGLVQGLPNGIGAGSTEYFVSRPRDGLLEARYLHAFFKMDAFREAGKTQMSGSVGHKRVPKSFILDSQLPLPPYNEQKRIADKLDAVLARVDACRERLDRVPAILKRFRQAVLAAATSGVLTEDWRAADLTEWESSTLGACGQVSGGLTKNAKRRELAIQKPYLRVANVYANRLDLSDVAEIGVTAGEFEKTRLRTGDLLIVEGNGSLEHLGRVARWGGELAECVHQNHLIRWRTSGPLPEWVLLWLLSPQGRRYLMDQASTTTGLHTLSISKVSAVPIKLPSKDEQADIVRRVESLFGWADRLEARLASARDQTDRLTPALLAKALRGELVPQDPADEPAAELLARVLQSKTDAGAALSRRGRRPAVIE